MKFKGEIFMLLAAIVLFAASAIFYSSTTSAEGQLTVASTPEFSYQGYAFSLVGLGTLLMVTASLSFLKRSRPTVMHVAKQISAKNCAD